MNTFLHSGCFGDIIYSLPSIKSLGGGHLYVCDRPWTKPLLHRISLLTALLLEQPCVQGISFYHPEDGDLATYDFSTFRFGGMKYGETIINRQARWVRTTVDTSSQWLTARPDPKASGRIIVNRCPRWHGFLFPWKRLVETFNDEFLFVGLSDEYQAFCTEFGRVEYARTENLLEAAQLIAGADMFIGNQSSCLAIAEGLHKPTIVEVCCWAIDCINIRPGNIHVLDGSLSFDLHGKHFDNDTSGLYVTKEESDLIHRAQDTIVNHISA